MVTPGTGQPTGTTLGHFPTPNTVFTQENLPQYPQSANSADTTPHRTRQTSPFGKDIPPAILNGRELPLTCLDGGHYCTIFEGIR